MLENSFFIVQINQIEVLLCLASFVVWRMVKLNIQGGQYNCQIGCSG